MNRDTFATYNPIICFTFFIGAIAFGMFFIHPVFLACSCILAAAYYVTIKGKQALKLIIGIIPILVLLSILNPIFNPYGDTVLFTYFNGRPYTLEALYYGIALATMFVSIILWFASYNSVMTSDKFMYIFGKFIPSISLVLTMVLRLVPNFHRKTLQITSARKCIGKAGSASGESSGKGNKSKKIKNGLTIISALTSWALEGGIITADSMRSRGYGSGRRSTFSIYRFGKRDKLLFICMLLLMAVVLVSGLMGAAKTTYTPRLYIADLYDGYSAVGIIAYFVFLVIPTALNITEEMAWRILKSRI